MTHSKTNSGFTLIEVLLALSMASLVLVPLLMLQGNNAEYVGLFAQRLNRIWRMERFLFVKQFDDGSNGKEDDFIKQEIDDPSMLLTFDRTAISEGSSLNSLEGLRRERVRAEWNGIVGKEEEDLVRFVFVLHKDEEK